MSAATRAAAWGSVGQAGASVPAQVQNLAAVPASTTQIDLTWDATSGATSYLVEQSPNGTTGWASVGTPGTNAQSVTGLSAGTQYFFRVSAVNAAGTGAASAVANATTTFAPSADPGLLIWTRADAGTFQAPAGAAATADADPVGQWQSGDPAPHHLAQTANNAWRPQLKQAIQNGLPVIRCDGSNDLMQSANGAVGTVTNLTVFLASALRATTNGQTRFGVSDGGYGGGNDWIVCDVTTSRRVRVVSKLGTIIDVTNGTPDTGWHIHEVVFEGGSLIRYLVDGVEATHANTIASLALSAEFDLAAFDHLGTPGGFGLLDAGELVATTTVDAAVRAQHRAWLGRWL